MILVIGNSEMKKALNSLLWHLAGSYLIVPLICAPFTLGASFFWYALPFAALRFTMPHYSEMLMIAALPFFPGLAIWGVRQFFRALLAAKKVERSRNYSQVQRF